MILNQLKQAKQLKAQKQNNEKIKEPKIQENSKKVNLNNQKEIQSPVLNNNTLGIEINKESIQNLRETQSPLLLSNKMRDSLKQSTQSKLKDSDIFKPNKQIQNQLPGIKITVIEDQNENQLDNPVQKEEQKIDAMSPNEKKQINHQVRKSGHSQYSSVKKSNDKKLNSDEEDIEDENEKQFNKNVLNVDQAPARKRLIQEQLQMQKERPMMIVSNQQVQAQVLKNAPLTEREQKEMKNLAKQLGIDYDLQSDRNEYSKMLRDMINTDLPEEYAKEIDTELNMY